MDLYCPKCGEPWEFDSLHEEAAARKEAGNYEASYDTVFADFRSRGCKALHAAFGAACSTPSTKRDSTFGLTRQEASAAMYEILGDDMDGAAAMLDDMGF